MYWGAGKGLFRDVYSHGLRRGDYSALRILTYVCIYIYICAYIDIVYVSTYIYIYTYICAYIHYVYVHALPGTCASYICRCMYEYMDTRQTNLRLARNYAIIIILR